MTGMTGGLPRFLRQALEVLDPGTGERLEELRLREGFPLSAVLAGEEWTHPAWGLRPITGEDLDRVLETVGQGSVHTILDQLREGYVTAAGGLRIGVCGEGAVKEGKLTAFRRVTSLAIRFPHRIVGLAGPLLPELLEEGRPVSTLILSPPGLGKTTLLRDLIRTISAGEGLSPLRVGVADQRGELGSGPLRRELGPRTDVLENCPKAEALMILLRAMNPQVLAADEITHPEDVRAMENAAGCGVVLLATAHGGSPGDLARRPLYRELMARGIFRRLVVISLEGGVRRYRVSGMEGRP